tara:strand:- start:4717 stop:6075 length:1359 start_codon:yes stop_codon:yes gene_type:complete
MSGPVVPFLEVTEVDGSPSGRPITKLVVSNGDLSISGTTATIVTASGDTDALTASYVGFGSASNVLTGAANFTWSEANQQLKITSDETADDSVMLHLDTDTFDGTMLRLESGKAHGEGGTGDDGPNIEIYRSTTGQNGKYIGSFIVSADNAADEKKNFFQLQNYISDSSTNEDSLVIFKALNNGVEDDFFRLRGGAGVIVNDNGRTSIDFRVESGSMSHAIAVDASQNRVGLLHSAMGDIEGAVDIKLPDDESVIIRNADDDANAGPILDLYRNNTDEDDNDVIGQIKFTGINSNNAKQPYVNIKGKIIDTTAATVAGSLVVTPIGVDGTATSAGAFQVRDGSITSYESIQVFRADATNQMNLTNEDLQSKYIIYSGTNTKQTFKLPAGVVGMKCKILHTGTTGFDIDPDNSNTGNTVNGSTSTIPRTGKAYVLNEIFCYEALKWVVTNESQ